jgi:hypothetical protein
MHGVVEREEVGEGGSRVECHRRYGWIYSRSWRWANNISGHTSGFHRVYVLLLLGCNNGTGIECKPCNFWENRLATFSMGSKDAPQKMQFLDAIKKVAGPFTFIQNAKVADTSHIWSRHQSNRSDSQCSCRIQELINRGKYAYMNLWVKWALVKSFDVSEITPVRSKIRRIRIHFSTKRLTFDAHVNVHTHNAGHITHIHRLNSMLKIVLE